MESRLPCFLFCRCPVFRARRVLPQRHIAPQSGRRRDTAPGYWKIPQLASFGRDDVDSSHESSDDRSMSAPASLGAPDHSLTRHQRGANPTGRRGEPPSRGCSEPSRLRSPRACDRACTRPRTPSCNDSSLRRSGGSDGSLARTVERFATPRGMRYRRRERHRVPGPRSGASPRA